MKIGFVYPQIELGGDPKALRRIGLAVEEMGYDHFLIYDHVVGTSQEGRKLAGPYTEEDPFHDPLIAMAYLAAITRRIEFATGILVLPQRQTMLVARQVADLHLLCGGRFRLGVGVGWNPVEFAALGQDFHSRGQRIDEQIDLLQRAWSEPLLSFEGRFDHLDRVAINPRPSRRIPIWIGGFGEAAFRRGGKVGDGFIFAAPRAVAFEQLGRVKYWLKEHGRSEDGYGFELIVIEQAQPAEVVDLLKRWKDAGGTHASISTMGRGLKSAEKHIEFLKRVLDLLPT